MKYICISLIKLYRMTLSKVLPPACRFTPSCSQYAVTAFERFGVLKGGYLTLRRILRCHPFNEGGADPVPEMFSITPPCRVATSPFSEVTPPCRVATSPLQEEVNNEKQSICDIA